MELVKKKRVDFKRGECCTNLNHLILIWMEGKSLDGFASPCGELNVKRALVAPPGPQMSAAHLDQKCKRKNGSRWLCDPWCSRWYPQPRSSHGKLEKPSCLEWFTLLQSMQQEPNESNERPFQRPVPRAQTRVQDFIWALVRVGELGCEEKQRRYLCRRQLSGAAALLHVRRILFACLNKVQKCRFINRKCPGPDSSDDVICSSCQRICGKGVAEGGEVCGDGLQGLDALQGSVSESTLHSGVTKATRESCAYILEIIKSIWNKRGFLGWVWWDIVRQCGVVWGRRQGQTHMQVQKCSQENSSK